MFKGILVIMSDIPRSIHVVTYLEGSFDFSNDASFSFISGLSLSKCSSIVNLNIVGTSFSGVCAFIAACFHMQTRALAFWPKRILKALGISQP